MASPQLSLTSFFSSYLTPAVKRAAWNLFWMLVGTAISQLSSFAALLILTHALGREQFGMLATALAVQGYVALLGSAGMPAVVVREMVLRPQDRSSIATTFLAISWTLGVLAALVTVVIVPWLGLSPAEQFLWIVLLVGTGIGCANPQFLFDALHRQAQPAIVIALLDITVLLLLAYFSIFSRLTLPIVGLVIAGKWALVVGILLALFSRYVKLELRSVKASEAGRLLSSSWPLLVSGVLSSIPLSGATILVRIYSGAIEAAYTGLAVQVCQTLLMAGVLAHRTVRPHVAGPYGFEPSFIRKLVFFYLLYCSVLGVLAVTACYIVIIFVMDPGYRPALPACLIAILAAVLGIAGTASNNYLLVLNKERRILLGYVFAAVLFLLCNVLFGFRLRAVGQLWATTLGFWVLSVHHISTLTLATWRVNKLELKPMTQVAPCQLLEQKDLIAKGL